MSSTAMDISAVQLPSAFALRVPLRRRLSPNTLSFPSLTKRRHVSLMCLQSNESKNPGFEANTAVAYSDATYDGLKHDYFSSIGPASETVVGESVNGSAGPKRSAKIHDFCFGIPFGGFVFGGGLIGFLFSRNVAVLSTVLFGGAIIVLSTCSLKVWRQGKSSLPFILGQAVVAAALAVKNFQAYSLTKKLFPSGFYALFSAAMFCFYSYVMLSGGNPPSKKLKAAATSASS